MTDDPRHGIAIQMKSKVDSVNKSPRPTVSSASWSSSVRRQDSKQVWVRGSDVTEVVQPKVVGSILYSESSGSHPW